MEKNTALTVFTDYLLNNPWHAAGIALMLSALPFLGWLGSVILAFVTLRVGAERGAWILGATLIPVIVWTFLGSPYAFVYSGIFGKILPYLLAVTLRYTTSLTRTLEVGIAFGMVSVVIAHIIVPNASEQWLSMFFKGFEQLKQANPNLSITWDQVQAMSTVVSKLAVGIEIAVMLLVAGIVNLLIARGWQARLYNPDGLRQELYRIRLDYIMVGVFLAVFLLWWLADNEISWSLLPIVLLPFFFAGLSMVHCLAVFSEYKWIFLVLLYGALVIFFQPMCLVLVVLAILDVPLNFRARLKII